MYLNILVRSGGHSYTCTNIKQDSVHIDMRGMDSIELTQVILSKMGKRKKPIALCLALMNTFGKLPGIYLNS